MVELRLPGIDFSALGDLRKTYNDAYYEAQAPRLLASLYPGQNAQQPVPAAANAPMVPQAPQNNTTQQIIKAESAGNPLAQNPNSSAAGPGQFINSTWLAMVKKNRPDLAAGKTDDEILSWRTNPAMQQLSTDMTKAYADENNGVLQRAGFQQTPGNTYLAHFAGPAGATALLRAAPETPVSQILSPDAIRANPQIANMTAGQIQQWANGKMQAGPQQAPAPQPQVAQANPAQGLTREQFQALLANPQTRGFAQSILAQHYTPKSPTVVPEGGSLVGPTGQVIFQGPTKTTDDTREYQLYVQQERAAGRTPLEFTPWMRDNKRAGASQVNIDQKGEGEFEKVMGKNAAERWSNYIKDADDAATQIPDIRNMRAISERLGQQGQAAAVKEFLGPYAEALGVNIEGLADMQAYSAIVKRLAPQQRAPGSGSTSDIEYKGFLRALPQLTDNPQARGIVLDTVEALAQERIARGDIARQLAAKEITRTEAERQIKALGDPLQRFKDWRKANPELYGNALKGYQPEAPTNPQPKPAPRNQQQQNRVPVEGDIIENKATGQRQTYQNGKWVPLQ